MIRTSLRLFISQHARGGLWLETTWSPWYFGVYRTASGASLAGVYFSPTTFVAPPFAGSLQIAMSPDMDRGKQPRCEQTCSIARTGAACKSWSEGDRWDMPPFSRCLVDGLLGATLVGSW